MRFLKTLREGKGWSRYRAAERIGVSTVRYDNLEAKAKGCDLSLLPRIRAAYGLSWAQLGKLLESEFSQDKPAGR